MSTPSPSPNDPRRLLLAGAAGIALGLLGPSDAGAATALPAAPASLSQTGLYVSGSVTQVRPGVVSFTPQHALWADGAEKQRWLRLPAGRAIDARRADAWDFPRGTLLWKEFSLGSRRVETRTLERLADGRWRFASYVWRDDGSDADLAPANGVRLKVAAAPAGRYSVPSQSDCLACHGSTAVPVLGASALQLGAQLPALLAQGHVDGLPAALLAPPARNATTPGTENAALGYLHANCGHCHNRSGKQVPVSLTLAQSALEPQTSRSTSLHSLLALPTRTGAAAIVPGNAQASAVWQRMASHQPHNRMPPLGTELPDATGLALISRWIDHDLAPPWRNHDDRRPPTPFCRQRGCPGLRGRLCTANGPEPDMTRALSGHPQDLKMPPVPALPAGQADHPHRPPHGPGPAGAAADADPGLQQLHRPRPRVDLRLPARDPGDHQPRARAAAPGRGRIGSGQVKRSPTRARAGPVLTPTQRPGLRAAADACVSERAHAALLAPVRRLTGPDAPAPASWRLEQAFVPRAAAIVDAVRAQVGAQEPATA